MWHVAVDDVVLDRLMSVSKPDAWVTKSTHHTPTRQMTSVPGFPPENINYIFVLFLVRRFAPLFE